jgi:hypothetical protein
VAGRYWLACPPPWIAGAALRDSEAPAHNVLKVPPMKVELRAINRIKPYASNPRHNDDVDAVAASIREFGFKQPLVVDEDGVIIVGHTR